MATTVNRISAGKICGAVLPYLATSAGYARGCVLTRSGRPDTNDVGKFFATSADVTIEAAGLAALRALGPDALARADHRAVSAGALADDGFRAGMEAIARRNGTRLRLFSP